MYFPYGRAQTKICKNITECESCLYYKVFLLKKKTTFDLGNITFVCCTSHAGWLFIAAKLSFFGSNYYIYFPLRWLATLE